MTPLISWDTLETSHTTHPFGGEYSRLYGEMLKYLGMLAACDLVPIFVFDGSHNREKFGFLLDHFRQTNVPLLYSTGFNVLEGETAECKLRAMRNKTKTCSVFSCKRFSIPDSPLNCVDPKPFPLLSLVLRNDHKKTVPRIDGVRRAHYPPDLPKRLREIDARVNWLSQLNNEDLTTPLNAILSQIDRKQLIQTGNRMMKSMLVNMVDWFRPGQEMARFLKLSQPI
ncbi:hypothetical protein D915_003370 [Fasciola hepatica]|uniref:XPG N-terminal domain-containing protein n=1 Tax=Fasciola hepatica TaxID=6192 RepID=A0A4E0S2D3_FASHE|nr:hypothetical protein D915_003370 [Fasciola hepatica]